MGKAFSRSSGESRVSEDFLVKRIEQNPTAVEGATLISASLFNRGDRVSLPASITSEWFDQNIIEGRPEKYFDALCRRRKDYAEQRFAVLHFFEPGRNDSMVVRSRS